MYLVQAIKLNQNIRKEYTFCYKIKQMADINKILSVILILKNMNLFSILDFLGSLLFAFYVQHLF